MRKWIAWTTVIAVILAIGLVQTAQSSEATSGIIKLAADNVELQLKKGSGLSGRGLITLTPGKNELEVEPGVYSPSSIRITAKEVIGEGDKKKEVPWMLRGGGQWGKLRTISVKAGETTELKPGAPLILKAKPSQKGNTVSINIAIVGQAGEEYSPGAYRDGKRVDPPKLKIVDESGKVLASGSFAYG